MGPIRTMIGLSQKEMLRLMINLRTKVYPTMRILQRTDGSIVVTIPPREEDRG